MRAFLTLVLPFLLAFSLEAQRSIEILGAPILNRTINLGLEYPATSSGNQYFLAVSPHSDSRTQFPSPTGISGYFLLNPVQFVVFLGGKLLGTMNFPMPIPNNNALIGAQVDFQYLDIVGPGSGFLSDEAVVSVIAGAGGGVGTSVFAEGSTATTVGFALGRVQNPSVGKPVVQNSSANWDRERLNYTGARGWVQGHLGDFGFTDYTVDPYVHKRDRVLRDARSNTMGGLALPNGTRFYVVRDSKNTAQFFCITIEDKTGKVTEIPGTRVTSLSAATPPANAYNDWFDASPDGNVVVVIVDYDSSSNTNDRILLIRTDGKNWNSPGIPGNGTPTLNVAPAGGYHSFVSDYLFLANEIVLTAGRLGGPAGTAGYVWAPLDGSAVAKPVVFPSAGTGVPPRWHHGSTRRISKDGKTVVIPRGHASSSTVGHDLYALTNISKTNVKVVNITAFPMDTTLSRFFGLSREAAVGFTAALSKDGKQIAFFGGYGGATVPNVLYVAPTDGSQAGKLKPAGAFPVGAVYMGTPHFLFTGEVVVLAGSAADSMDLYKVNVTAGTTTNLTNKGNVNVHWSLLSDNGLNLYFGRGYPTASNNPAANIIGVNLAGTLVNVTGSEFPGGAGPASMELSTNSYENEFRIAPNLSNEIYFIGRPERKIVGTTTTYFDANVYKFNFESGGQAKKVTNYTGSSPSLNAVMHIENLNVLSTGSVVYAASKGPAGTAPGQEQRVTWHKGDGLSGAVVLGQFARGAFVNPGSLRVVESLGAAYWVQSSTGSSTDTRGYYVRLDGSMKGHPLNLTGVPDPTSVGFMVNLSAGDTNL